MKIEYPVSQQIPVLKKLWTDCFPDPEAFVDGFFRTAFTMEKCRLITVGETVAAALYWMDADYQNQKFAYIYAVATHPDYRGRGLCRRLMEDTHVLLRSQGYSGALLLPGEAELRRMYEKLGYRDCCQAAQLHCAAGKAIPIKEIIWQEYDALRRSYLPQDGAWQDGLLFLSTYAKFYQGEGFILAGLREEERFMGLELLGDTSAVSGILAALGCREGTFRTPGKERQTVMVLPLRQGLRLPGYVGLTLD